MSRAIAFRSAGWQRLTIGARVWNMLRVPRLRIRRVVAAAVAITFAALGARSARADSGADADRVLATELFQEGRALLADKRYAEACGKLEESQRLDPGGGTLLNVALCHELEGRTATAWSEFNGALAVARRDGRSDRAGEAERHIQALEQRLTRLVIVVPAAARAPGILVRRDGTVLATAVWGAAVPINPGTHVVEAVLPGCSSWRTSVDLLQEGTSTTVEIPVREPCSPGASPGPLLQPAAVSPPVSSARPMSVERPAGPTWQRPAAATVIALGAAGVVAGATLGLRAASEWSDAQRGCSNGTCHDDVSYHEWQNSVASATWATIAMTTGLVLATAGSIWWVKAPLSVPVRIGIVPGGLHVAGAF